MLRKNGFGLAALVALAAGPPLTAKSYDAERFDVGFRLESGGSALVRETVTFRFRGGPFTYVFRDLDTARTDGIRDIHVEMDGQAMTEGEGPGQAEVRTGHPVKVIWHFAPVSDATHTFEVTYRALGVVRVSGGADSVLWQAVPRNHRYRIAEGSVTMEYPEATPVVGTPELRGARARVEAGSGETRFQFGRVNPQRAVTLSAAFAPRSLASNPPRWQAREAEHSERLRSAIPSGIAAGIAAFALALVFFLRMRAEVDQGLRQARAALRVTQPPSELAPALAGRLLSMSHPTGRLVMATLFDLAARGAVRIDETPKRRLGRDFQVNLLRPELATLRHEHFVLDMLFAKGREIRLSKVGSKLIQNSNGFERTVIEGMVSIGLVDPERHRVRNRIMRWGVVLLLVGMGAFLGGVAWISWISRGEVWDVLLAAAVVVGAGAGIFLASIVGLILFSLASSLTSQGIADESQWRAFGRHLQAVAKGREPETGTQVFERYLPYATAFGFGSAWVKHFNKSGMVVPDWFQAADANDGNAAIIALIAVSSSPSGAGAASAGGASGGGSSGAG